MDWTHPYLLLFPVAVLLLWVFHRFTVRPISIGRRRALLVVRCTLVAVALLPLARPAIRKSTERQAVVFALDHSQSQGESGMRKIHERAAERKWTVKERKERNGHA